MSASAPIVLALRGLRKDRRTERAEHYSLSVPALNVRLGEKILISGPSGAGKSTFLDMAAMALKPDAADEFFFFPGARAGDGKACDIAAAWMRKDIERLAMWRKHVGYVLQTGGLLPFLNAEDNIRVPSRLLGLPAQRDKTERMAERLKISKLLKKFPSQLSVGERQRVAIARALAADPPLVLADEPLASLDPENARAVLGMFMDSIEDAGTTLIVASHATDLMENMNFRHLILETGARDGKASAVLRAVHE
ncbi:MAG: ATP-binding cassette domain-containing protein [Desulfovibrio sp.]|jgi:putative ABC transport system ATP-binding protein|nr:ATP-binding cassette domain-containing protein [Desulfovibrio sp.]